ncbi:MAG: nucleoside monophosphate kinase [Firmicutes bacterium]|nr:nucleoside monophosphate kinase [Bacillota bacterium]MCL2770808.1 nucleoside monophosphate kinase [Bacillota bacterium]
MHNYGKDAIVIMGMQGTGKGTQGAFIVQEYGFHVIAPGDLYRAAFKRQDKQAILAKQYTDRGELAPDEITNKLAEKEVRHNPDAKGFLLDGYPRNEKQFDAATQMLNTVAVVALFAPEEELVERLRSRFNCGTCGKKVTMCDEKKRPICKCGGAGIRRDDDNDINSIKQRIQIYKESTEPLIEKYRKMKTKDGRSIVLDVNAAGTVEEVREEMLKKLKELLGK